MRPHTAVCPARPCLACPPLLAAPHSTLCRASLPSLAPTTSPSPFSIPDLHGCRRHPQPREGPNHRDRDTIRTRCDTPARPPASPEPGLAGTRWRRAPAVPGRQARRARSRTCLPQPQLQLQPSARPRPAATRARRRPPYQPRPGWPGPAGPTRAARIHLRGATGGRRGRPPPRTAANRGDPRGAAMACRPPAPPRTRVSRHRPTGQAGQAYRAAQTQTTARMGRGRTRPRFGSRRSGWWVSASRSGRSPAR
jgi:hypothetical protein